MISTVSDACVRALCLWLPHVPRLSTHYTTAFRLSFTLTVLRRKTVLSDQTRKLHEDCMLDWSGTLRSRGQCCPRGRSMPPPLERLRLPSDIDTFPPPVHESVSGTSLTTIGQELSGRRFSFPDAIRRYNIPLTVVLSPYSTVRSARLSA